MGFGGIGFPELLLILLIVFLLFGSKKLSSLGRDLGGAIKDFRKSMKEDESAANALPNTSSPPEVHVEPADVSTKETTASDKTSSA